MAEARGPREGRLRAVDGREGSGTPEPRMSRAGPWLTARPGRAGPGYTAGANRAAASMPHKARTEFQGVHRCRTLAQSRHR